MWHNLGQDGIRGAICLIPNIEVDLLISSEGLGHSYRYFPFLDLQEYQANQLYCYGVKTPEELARPNAKSNKILVGTFHL